eukprot:1004073-Amorphochlora_amoeboformis.AAC.1
MSGIPGISPGFKIDIFARNPRDYLGIRAANYGDGIWRNDGKYVDGDMIRPAIESSLGSD